MLRWLYIQLLWAHPAGFRYRFGDEMLEAFDFARLPVERWSVFLDGAVSLLRQWTLRPEFHRPWQAARIDGPVYEPITFHQIEPYKPSGVALTQGGLLALLVMLGVVNMINHGGGKLRSFVIGMHRPGFGLIKVARESFEGERPNTMVERALDQDDPLRPFARSYFRIVRVLSDLDRDGDLKISPAELLLAPEALRRLDLNHDGKLSAEECGYLPEGDRGAFVRSNPVLAALDSNHDGMISAAEIAHSTEALKALDIDHDGTLSPYELLPNPAVSQAAAMIGRFDTNDSGVISIQGLSKEDPDVAVIRQILAAADRNHDGVVTRGELVVEMARRTRDNWVQTPLAIPEK